MVTHDRASRPGRPSVSLRTSVTGVILLALLPLLIHVAVNTWYSYSAVRQWAVRDLMGAAEHLARDVDAQFNASRMVMRLVAASPAAQRGDLVAMRQDLERAQAQGLIAAAAIRDEQGGVLLAVGISEDHAATLGQVASGQFLVETLREQPALVAAWPIQSADPRVAQLVFLVAVEIAAAQVVHTTSWPWRVTAVADRDGRIAWLSGSAGQTHLLSGMLTPDLMAGVLPDWDDPRGERQASAFARAARSGLIVVIGQPMPRLYERLPLGLTGSLAVAAAAVVASLVLARRGARQIHAEYQAAMRGTLAGAVGIDDAAHLGVALRTSRNRLFQAAGGIAVLELWRPPGVQWRDARIVASPNASVLLDLGEAELTADALTRSMMPPDRAAVTALLATVDADAAGFTRTVRFQRPDGAVLHINMVGMLRDVVAGGHSELVLMLQDVTAQKATEDELVVQASRLRLAIGVAQLGVWERDTVRQVFYPSEQFWQIVGQEARAELDLAGFMAMVHPGDRTRIAAALASLDPAEVVRPGAPPTPPREFFCRFLRQDGETRHVRSSRVVVADASGAATRVVGVLFDETEVVLAQRKLAASEARFRLALDVAELAVFERHADGPRSITVWNERMWHMRGLAPRTEPLSDDEMLAMVHPEDRDRIRLLMEARETNAEGASDYEFRIIRPDGAERIIHSRSLRVRHAEPREISFVAINQDVTERRQAERALTQSAARFRLAVETAGLGVAELNPATGRGTWNERLFRICGLEPQAERPTLDQGVALAHPDDRAGYVAFFATQRDAVEGTVGEHDYRIIRPDGEERVLHLRLASFNPPGGERVVISVTQDITEQRRAAQALQDKTTTLELAVEAAELGVFQFSMPAGTGYWSDRMWRMRGWQPRPGLPDAEEAVSAVHPDDRAAIRDLLADSGQRPHGDVDAHQYRIVMPNGAVRHIAAHTIVLHGPAKGAWTKVGVNADVSGQVEREQALRETLARLELVIDAAGLAVWDWNPDSDRMIWSPRLWEQSGFVPQDSVPSPKDRHRFVHPNDRDLVPTAWLHDVSVGKDHRGEGEFRVIPPDGAVRYLHWRGIPLRDAQGRILRFAGIVADVTKARLADLALRTSEELFRMAAEAAEQGVWNHDLATGAITWSARLWRIHGLPPQEDAPTREDRIAFIHPEDREEVLGLGEKLQAAPPNTGIRRIYRILRADGAVRTMDRQAMLVAGAEGRPARIVGVVRDVTEERELSAQLMVADKLATLGEMAGAIAHELAQPLQAVMATAATARLRLSIAEDTATIQAVSERLVWIERQTARAGKTIQHLLSFSRGESSDNFTRLAQAVEGAIELAGHGLRRAGITVEVDLPDDLPLVRGGQIAIEQVLVNLLNNARDAIGEVAAPNATGARVVRSIAITAHCEGSSVSLAVTDTGGGIPQDRMERIFEPFYTTKPLGRGTGIGLSIARRTMHAVGGTITVSNAALGARFVLMFETDPLI